MKYFISLIYAAIAFSLSAQWYFAAKALYLYKGEYLIISGLIFPIFIFLFIVLCTISFLSRGLLRSGYAAVIVLFLELGLFAVERFLGS